MNQFPTYIIVFASLFLTTSFSTAAGETFQEVDSGSHAEYVYATVFSRDGSALFTASGDNKAVIWSTQPLRQRHVLEHEAAVYSADCNPDQSLIATGSGDGRVSLWNANTGERQSTIQVHTDAIYAVSFSPDGQLLAGAGGSTDGGDTAVRVWTVADGTIHRTWAGHERQVYGLIWSPDGTTLASSSSDHAIRLWNTADDQCRILKGHTSDVYRCAFSPDGQWLASSSQDKTVRVWHVATGECRANLKDSRDPSYDVRFLQNGKQLSSVSGDGRLRTWSMDALDRAPIQTKIVRAALYAIGYDARSRTIVVAGETGSLFTSPAADLKPK